MKTVNAIRVAEWRDIQTLFAVTLDEATAMKNLGMRWHCRALENIGNEGIRALVGGNAPANAIALVSVTPRNIITASAFAEAELSVWDADSADFWPPKMRAALESLARNMADMRKTLLF